MQINRLAQQCCTNYKDHTLCASQYVETALFVSVSLVVLCRIYSATYNNKTTRKLEITKQSLSVNLELANKYTVTKTERKN